MGFCCASPTARLVEHTAQTLSSVNPDAYFGPSSVDEVSRSDIGPSLGSEQTPSPKAPRWSNGPDQWSETKVQLHFVASTFMLAGDGGMQRSQLHMAHSGLKAASSTHHSFVVCVLKTMCLF